MTPTSRRGQDLSQQLRDAGGWYHSFELPDGSVIRGCISLETLRERYRRIPIPGDLAGKRVLDIGAWDGWFSFEAERRGASVTAMDCVEVPNFLHVHRALGSKVDYRILDFYELPEAGLGPFDFVFFLGVLYHLKHPLLALEIVCGLTADTAIVESFVTDAGTWRDHRHEIPTMEFYETDELGGQLDNWIGPSVGCLLAMCRAAGFARVELLHTGGSIAMVACHRKWEPAPVAPKREPPEWVAAANTRTLGVNFSSRKEQYISCWFRTPGPVTREQLRFQVAGWGVPALWVRSEGEDLWLANFRLPPGLDAGWKDVRLRLADSAFGSTGRIAVDLPLDVRELVLRGVTDGFTWSEAEVTLREGAVVSCWVAGLPENADRANVTVRLGGVKLRIEYISATDDAGCRQINASVPADFARGEHPLTVECGGVRSAARVVRLV